MHTLKKSFASFRNKETYLDYLIYNPGDLQTSKPLIIYLHGAGSRGNKITAIPRVSLIGEIENGMKLDAVVVAPQCHCETWFDLYSVLVDFIDYFRNQPFIDNDRVYLTGVSMGGYAVWQLCISHPDWFAAAVPVCGGGMYWNAARLRHLPIWAFHGIEDDIVLPCESEYMVEAINNAGGDARLTLIPGTGHDAWRYTYRCDEMWGWLFNNKRNCMDTFRPTTDSREECGITKETGGYPDDTNYRFQSESNFSGNLG